VILSAWNICGVQRQRSENLLRTHLRLAEWVDSVVVMPGEYARCAEQGPRMALYRLASPARLKDMMHIVGVSRNQISCVVADLARFLYDRYHRKP